MIKFWLRDPLREEAGTDGDPAGGGDQLQDGKPAAAPDAAKALADEVAALRAQLSEKDEATRYWHEQAKAAAQKSPSNEDAKPAEDDTDLLDLISTKGAKGLKDWMGKQGYVPAAEVDKRVEAKARQIAREAELTGKYPDLKDPKSDFFKATAAEFGRLKGAMPDDVAMEIAAERAELAQLRAGKQTATNQDDSRERDQERRDRIRAQQGDDGRRTTKGKGDEGSDDLTAEQLQICSAMGIEPKAYQKRAKEGVQFARMK